MRYDAALHCPEAFVTGLQRTSGVRQNMAILPQPSSQQPHAQSLWQVYPRTTVIEPLTPPPLPPRPLPLMKSPVSWAVSETYTASLHACSAPSSARFDSEHTRAGQGEAEQHEVEERERPDQMGGLSRGPDWQSH